MAASEPVAPAFSVVVGAVDGGVFCLGPVLGAPSAWSDFGGWGGMEEGGGRGVLGGAGLEDGERTASGGWPDQTDRSRRGGGSFFFFFCARFFVPPGAGRKHCECDAAATPHTTARCAARPGSHTGRGVPRGEPAGRPAGPPACPAAFVTHPAPSPDAKASCQASLTLRGGRVPQVPSWLRPSRDGGLMTQTAACSCFAWQR